MSSSEWELGQAQEKEVVEYQRYPQEGVDNKIDEKEIG